jgi:antitoxin MazE
MQKTSTLSLQQWGNSLAVRIPAAVARLAHFSLGQPVELVVENESVVGSVDNLC